ncbi:GNAT family N-acetyltransferase [Chroococcus sp. FPU101]|uniref:GNAT family N-acetyltransferase n=1 Tax=Chroococcus sp. FPU101 TaxID=1974212 RepID=UPI001A8EB358|nr:GNAT family N-acetyltransferase [Chroococcus sp. FPU101]GFE67938.1 GCN5-related N-acetyltransferase [Chroococcus sp. FPU101]
MNIRPANPNDVTLIYSFIKKKAEFDRNIGAFQGVLEVTEEKIQKTLFGNIPFSYVLFVENAGNEIGFALYNFRYSSFSGQPSIWIDDLYVDESQRSQGAGLILMNKLAQIASRTDCTHLAWNADVRNIRGLNFYNKIGAKINKQEENRCFLTWLP